MAKQAKYDRSDIRRLNGISVLDQLRRNGPMSRANIAAQLGLTRATVSNIVAEFIEASLILETEYVGGAAGRPGLMLNLNANYGSMIAVELELDRISLLLTNVGQEELWSEQVPVAPDLPPEETLALAEGLLSQAFKVSQERKLKCYGVGVALAGLVNREVGQLAYGPTSGWEQIPLKEQWENQFKVPVYLENAAHAGALGVYHFGAARGKKNIVYLSMGVGLAAGIFCDGRLLHGKQGFAGQVGYTRFSDNNIASSSGKQGAWVTEIGAAAVARKLVAAGVELPDPQAAGMEWMEVAMELARQQDATAIKVLNEVGRQVGQGMANLVLTFNPSMLIVGGRMGALMKFAESGMRAGVMEDVLPYMKENLELVVSDAGDEQLQGCLATVFDFLMKNPEL
ncbi:MAG: ROK family transcriptional regulator [Verrucomicrobiota bacterium]